jgi:hypothetical protein
MRTEFVKSTFARRIFTLAMCVLVTLMSPMQALAEGEAANQGGEYLAEVYLAVAPTADEAAKSLQAKGYEVLRYDGNPADLNQGAGSALKEDRAVVLGYKTTADSTKAVTDLAVMNMNGGYSVVDYQSLINRYRDSQVRPFIERFMTALQEYRANVASESVGNRARADFVRAMLNHIKDDDTGGSLGDLLINQTKAELGDAYERLSEEERREHIDLELALMQGSAEVVYQAEQLIGYAADTAETTWLDRLSALGPNGLAESYGDMPPTDAKQDMAAKYQDIASLLSQDWEKVRTALMAYNVEDGESQEQSTAESSSSPDAAEASPDGVVQGEADAIDPSSVVKIDVEVPSDDAKTPTPQDAVEILNHINECNTAIGQSTDTVNSTRIAALYYYLKSKPYGEETLYDLFTRPTSEIVSDDYAALYPVASCLSAGQVAAIEFLPLEYLLQIGATSGDAVAEGWTGDTGLKDIPELLQDVSLYQGVNREIFSDKTALTSEALRTQALQREDTGVVDFVSAHKVTALLYAGTAISAVLTGISAIAHASVLKSAVAHAQAMNMVGSVESTVDGIKKVGNALIAEKQHFVVNRVRAMSFMNLGDESVDSVRIMLDLDDSPLLSNELVTYTDPLVEDYVYVKDTAVLDAADDLNAAKTEFVSKMEEINKKQKDFNKRATSRWGTAKTVFAVATVLLLIASIGSTVADIISYYNAKYAPIPKYIVDEKAITATAKDGSKVFARNDTAYYRVAETDAKREKEDLKNMQSYADLNGDKGKEWLALYTLRGSGDPILADSLKVVVGTSSLPFGYSAGIHAFGSDAAFNLTDSRYCYNDKANGVYTYFTRKALEAPVASSAFAGGGTAVVGGICLAAGAAIGAGGMYLVGRRRRDTI